jgi:2,3-bisphosphoglycerate-independent phosphoglycerate mutase
MKFCILVLDGASGLPVGELDGKTCLEAARTPNLDEMARAGTVGTASTVPDGMEPSSAAACTSILGFDPRANYVGRGAIEAAALEIDLKDGDVAFRCNLVYVADSVMRDYSAGHISTEESHRIVRRLDEALGDGGARFFPGVAYRHILLLDDGEEALAAVCTPPHDIPDRPIDSFLPHGPGSRRLLELMERAKPILESDPTNAERIARGDVPATMTWLFWGGAKPTGLAGFEETYHLRAAITSGVDLLRGLAKLFGLTQLSIPGVTDGPDNDYAAQASGALAALDDHDLVVIHVESPDEAAHGGDWRAKIEAIERIDAEIVPRLRAYAPELRILAMPDHPTPIVKRTHVAAPVPFLLCGPGVEPNGADSFTEATARSTGLVIDEGWALMRMLIR